MIDPAEIAELRELLRVSPIVLSAKGARRRLVRVQQLLPKLLAEAERCSRLEALLRVTFADLQQGKVRGACDRIAKELDK